MRISDWSSDVCSSDLLRLLTNLETSERKLLQIILIGQPELRTILAKPELEQLAQRVIARFHLGTLDKAETLQYVQHRSEELRVGKECVSTCSSRWSTHH